MGTSAKLLIIEEPSHTESVDLFRLQDGYPQHVIPTIFKAFKYKCILNPSGNKYDDLVIEKSKAGKVASLLCWADPLAFMPAPEDAYNFCADYSYILYCSYSRIKKKPIWEIEIYDGEPYNGNLLAKRNPIEVFIKVF